MASIRWGVIAATGAFLLSLCLGILAGNQALRTVLTAFVFGLTFFGIGFCLRLIMNNFFPELVFEGEQPDSAESYEEDTPHMSVTLENSGEYAVPEMYRIPGKNPELGNIEDLISGNYTIRQERVDSQPEAGYNNDTSVLMGPEEESSMPIQPQVFAQGVTQGFTPSFGDGEGLGGLPDLDVMAMAFSGIGAEGVTSEAPAVSAGADDFYYNNAAEPVPATQQDDPDRSQYKGNKPQPLEGDFDAKQIAQGIRTVLNKEK